MPITPPIIQFKRGLRSNLPGLAAGEPGFTTDRYELWIGLDGNPNNNKFFGSDRYWQRESNAIGGGIRFYEGTDNGTHRIILKAPNTLDFPDQTYTLPSDPIKDWILATDEYGNWFWTNELKNTTISGEVTINTGSVSIGNTFAKFDTEIFDISSRIFNVGLAVTSPNNTTWDLAVLFNYYKSGSKYRSGIFWDDSAGRIGIASHIQFINNEFGTSDSSPIIDTSSLNWAPVEIGSLWVNDCSGQSQVISCTNSERTLENISIDCGSY
jgi:hypothetical protein